MNPRDRMIIENEEKVETIFLILISDPIATDRTYKEQ
jgi:hypothetical protein